MNPGYRVHEVPEQITTEDLKKFQELWDEYPPLYRLMQEIRDMLAGFLGVKTRHISGGKAKGAGTENPDEILRHLQLMGMRVRGKEN